MTDILDLPGWKAISKRRDGDEYVIEAEYTTQPINCPKCGVVDTPYKHGVKPIKYRDSPIRGDAVVILANVQRYRCKHWTNLIGSNLYTSPQPPQAAPRVPMTDDEIRQCRLETEYDGTPSEPLIHRSTHSRFMAFARAVEQFHGIGVNP